LLDVVGDFLFLAVINRFGVIRKRRRTPRVAIGQLVVQREAWYVEASEFEHVLDADEAQAFRKMREWASSQEIPAKAFVKVPWEDKPFYVDFDSPVFVRMFCKQLRNALDSGTLDHAMVSLSEMLPDFEQLWLRQDDGQAYTAELRLVALHEDDVGR
jgi:hypothetical protein